MACIAHLQNIAGAEWLQVATLEQRTWTNGLARNRLRILLFLIQLDGLETMSCHLLCIRLFMRTLRFGG